MIPPAEMSGKAQAAGRSSFENGIPAHRSGACRFHLVVLAGFLSLYDPPSALVGRVMNVHPALLPAFGGKGFYGARVHRAVLDAGVRVTGVTAHFVDSVYDRGRIITQWPVPVFASDDCRVRRARRIGPGYTALPATRP